MVGATENEVQNGLSAASFWECREYHRTIKRVDTANKLCSELSLMIQERAEIEKAYSANLKRWSNRWLSFLDSGLEYASGASPWKGLCKEAEAVSNAHQDVRNTLIDELQTGLKHWQKEHFHKTPLPPQGLKEAKQFEQEFEQAQKPWAKRLKKVSQAKKDYHQACKMERSLQVQVQNAKNDPAGTAEQLKKTQEKYAKAEKEVERTRANYNNTLSELHAECPRYLEEMTKVFNKAQDFERERLVFFKDLFKCLQEALNVTLKADYNNIYRDLETAISQCDVEADLSWWSSHHGIDMPAIFPEFEEYTPELTALSNKKRSVVADTSQGVTLTGITPLSSTETPEKPNQPAVAPSPANGPSQPTPFDDAVTPTDTRNSNLMAQSEASTTAAMTGAATTQAAGAAATGADDMSDADYYASATYDDGRPGIPVRALYDYTGQEDDEITFKAGDRLEKLEEADDQGWCKGRKDGRCGLYPANYAEEI
ncbi:unnamed protein product [Calicophoron daubneyi]|uniref:Protein kinase C and casein kinase substrate in neurons protein 1 n=1 Tax=Calicophoron daubneyi TaxID=300641 RepID=A0AAV2TY34_CALDB